MEHTVLDQVNDIRDWRLSWERLHTSSPHQLPPKQLLGLFHILNTANPVAWAHVAVLRRRMVFGGLALVQVVFILPPTPIRGLWAAVWAQHVVITTFTRFWSSLHLPWLLFPLCITALSTTRFRSLNLISSWCGPWWAASLIVRSLLYSCGIMSNGAISAEQTIKTDMLVLFQVNALTWPMWEDTNAVI